MTRDLFIKKDSSLFVVIISMIFFVLDILLFSTLLLNQWEKQFERNLQTNTSIQIPVTSLSEQQIAKLKQTSKTILSNTSSVLDYHMYSNNDIYALVKPWISSKKSLSHLSLPIFIAVNLQSSTAFVDLKSKFARRIPSAVIGSNAKWISVIQAKIRPFKIILWGLNILLAFVGFFLLIYTVYASLRVNQQRIYTLNLIGATDSFIVNHFRRYFIGLTIQGWMIGIVGCSILTLMLKYFIFSNPPWMGTWVLTVPNWIILGSFMVFFFIIIERILSVASYRQLRRIY